jgi:tRNA(adenine34) deaminase
MAEAESSPTEDPEHLRWMRRAIELAQVAVDAEEVPVGAVIVRDGEVLSEAHNRTVGDADPCAHAEVLAIRAAAAAMGDWRLLDTVLYVTLEPCAMCAGAIVLARIPHVVFGTHDPKAGMAGSLENLIQDERLNHRCEVTSGVLRDESSQLLKSFFRERRR